ncbi:ANKRD50, partial [Symbiodinium natans]
MHIVFTSLQELYFFNKLSLQLYSEVNPISDAAVNCLEPVRPSPVVESTLPEELTKTETFDLLGHDFEVKPDVMGGDSLWHKASQISFKKFKKPSSNVGEKAKRGKVLTDSPKTSGTDKTCVFNKPCKGFTCAIKKIKNRYWSVKMKRKYRIMSLEFTIGDEPLE